MGIKKVFGWIFLFIGCTQFGSLPFSAFYPYLTESPYIISGRIAGGLLIAFVFTYFGWKWTKREPPESNKILVIPIILFLLVGFMTGIIMTETDYGDYYEKYEIPDFEYESIPSTPVSYYYEKYGFSFTCPPDMTNISEEGYMSDNPDNNSGIVEITNDKGTKAIYITWLTITEPELLYSLRDTLKETIDKSMKLEGVSNVKLEEIEEITINKHQGVYAPLNFNYYGLPSYDIYCIWYCNQSQRLYYVGIETYSSEETKELFNKVVDSFICH